MENNLENKTRFFAQYIHQRVLVGSITDNTIEVLRNADISCIDNGEQKWFLLLNALSAITDKDALQLWNLLHDYSNAAHLTQAQLISQGRNIAKNMQYINGSWLVSLGATIMCADFLRSKGYALPFNGLNVDEMVEHGWIKLTHL